LCVGVARERERERERVRERERERERERGRERVRERVCVRLAVCSVCPVYEGQQQQQHRDDIQRERDYTASITVIIGMMPCLYY
jgi:hypothetical protein